MGLGVYILMKSCHVIKDFVQLINFWRLRKFSVGDVTKNKNIKTLIYHFKTTLFNA